MPPLIGITRTTADGLERYADAVRRSGGEPVAFLFDGPDTPDLARELDRVDALVVSGGEDVHPSRYGREPTHDEHTSWCTARDDAELAALPLALTRNMPVLGICRGMHALNVAMGGTLTQHVDGHNVVDRDGERLSTFHRIYIAPGSRLASIVGSGGFVRVNSRHHQGVREADRARGLLASAYSLDDGLVEALESPSHRFVLGTQFHPERRAEVPPHLWRVFDALVRWAADFKVSR